jgi:hypothetical protein
MITRIRIRRFKRFEIEIIDLDNPVILLAGPNNSGKTTALQAIAVWNLALSRWLEERGADPASKRISITLDEFTALPLREANLLWLNRRTAVYVPDKKTPTSAPIAIELENELAGKKWSFAMELMYASSKVIYVRPVDFDNPSKTTPAVPKEAQDLHVVHVPPFSGIETEEPRHDVGIQNRLIGQGRPGEVIRNLLWELWDNPDKSAWQSLVQDIERLFQYELLEPRYPPASPFIVCEYRPGLQGKSLPALDIANAGSGFHQVLLLLAFFYDRPASVLLLDEPDAHLHFILQREIFDHLRAVAGERACQLIVATHSEVLLQDAEPTDVISFIGPNPRRLLSHQQLVNLRDALKRLTSLDLLRANQVKAILYVEDDSDYKILREWAAVLGHPARSFLKSPFVYPMGGIGRLGEIKRHFSALRLAYPEIKGLCLIDRDEYTGPESQDLPAGLPLLRWGRREIENYLLNPTVLERYVSEPLVKLGPIFKSVSIGSGVIKEEFERQRMMDADYLSDDLLALTEPKASQFLVSLLGRTERRTAKRDLYLIARVMKAEEIHPEVIKKLDAIAELLPEDDIE